MCVCACICMFACVSVCTCICAFVCMYTWACVLWECVYMHEYVYVCGWMWFWNWAQVLTHVRPISELWPQPRVLVINLTISLIPMLGCHILWFLSWLSPSWIVSTTVVSEDPWLIVTQTAGVHLAPLLCKTTFLRKSRSVALYHPGSPVSLLLYSRAY